MFEWKIITNIHNISTKIQLVNCLTTKGPSTKELLNLLQQAVMNIWNLSVCCYVCCFLEGIDVMISIG